MRFPRIFGTLLGLSLFFGLQAAVPTMGEVFDQVARRYLWWGIPQALGTELSHPLSSMRLDSIPDGIGGKYHIDAQDDDNHYLQISTSRSGTLTLRLFEGEGGSWTGVMTFTVCAPICDSSILLFDDAYNRLPEGVFLISHDDFLRYDALYPAARHASIVEGLDILFAHIVLPREGDSLQIISGSAAYLDESVYACLKPYLLGDVLTIAWDGHAFSKQGVSWLSAPEVPSE